MDWLKHVVVDVLATICILLATVAGQTWAAWIVWIYTPLLLLLKLGALGANLPRAKDSAPDWFFHLLYGSNVLISGWYAWTSQSTNWAWVAAGWMVIWVLSAVVAARQRS